MAKTTGSFVLRLSGYWPGGVVLCLAVVLQSCNLKQNTVEPETEALVPVPAMKEWEAETGPPGRETVRETSLPVKTTQISSRLDSLAQAWKGVPHRMGGNTREGIDCSGLACLVYREVYNHRFVSRSSADIFKECTPVKQDSLVPGDLVFFKITGSRIDHVGVYLGEGNFLHASVRRGVMVSSLYEPYYTRNFYSGGRPERNH